MNILSPSRLAWRAAGCPIPPYLVTDDTGSCSVCGQCISRGIALREIETPTMGAHADIFRFGSQHVCEACAWLFAAGKGAPGNFIVAGDHLEYTVISLESVVAAKRPWLAVLRDLIQLPADTQITGVMTTDVKPRLWPRMRLASVGAFGLYLHAGDYDVSEWREFNLAECLVITEALIPPLTAGFAKASLYFGLFRDHARASKRLGEVYAWEQILQPLRRSAAFLPALIAAGVTKGEKQDVKRNRSDCDPQPSTTGRHLPAPSQPGLF